MHKILSQFRFAPAKSSERKLLHQWFEQRHILEWMHGVGLQNTLNGLEKFFEGKTDTIYWIGFDRETPFAFLITSPEGKDAMTLDLFICDLNYLGKGLAVPMIKEFLTSQFPHVKRVLIDPEVKKTRRPFTCMRRQVLKLRESSLRNGILFPIIKWSSIWENSNEDRAASFTRVAKRGF